MAGTTVNQYRNLHRELVHRLGLEIVGGGLRPGEQLPVNGDSLADLVVSRTVAREAVRVLAAKGLLEARPYSGTRVRPRSEWHLLDPEVLSWIGEVEPDAELLRGLTELRFLIEPGAARFAADRATPQQRQLLGEHYQEMVATANEPGMFAAADVRFHSLILVSAHNAFLSQFDAVIAAALAGTRAQVTRIWANRRGTKMLAATLPFHQAVVEAIVSRSPDAAEAAMRAVVQKALDDLGLIDEELGSSR